MDKSHNSTDEAIEALNASNVSLPILDNLPKRRMQKSKIDSTFLTDHLNTLRSDYEEEDFYENSGARQSYDLVPIHDEE